MSRPLVRVEDAALGPDAQVRLVVSGVSDPDRLRTAWASSGAALERRGLRIHATTTVQALARAAGRALPREEAAVLDTALRSAIEAWREPPPALLLHRGGLDLDVRPGVVGIVNVTPDSFADGGRYPEGHPEASVELAHRLLSEGADVLDVGGESTRPGAEPVTEAEELERVLPVVEALAGRALVSVDTAKAGVAQAALKAGAVIVNDVSGARDPDLLSVAAEAEAGYVLMHTRGTPRDMDTLAQYDDVVAEVYEFLAEGIERCASAGIDPQRIVVDPGIGFAKTAEHSLALLGALRQLSGLGRPVLVGASRKSFLGRVGAGDDPADRLEGSLAVAALAVAAGAALVRVHDVAETVDAIRVARAVTTGVSDWSPIGPLPPG